MLGGGDGGESSRHGMIRRGQDLHWLLGRTKDEDSSQQQVDLLYCSSSRVKGERTSHVSWCRMRRI